MKRRQTYAAVLQESGGFGDTQKEHSGYLIPNHGPPGTGVMARGQGVGIILSPDAQKAWTLAGSQVLHFGTNHGHTASDGGRQGTAINHFLG